jgi:APA family basic amino acid/polyamine antiporter
MMPRRSSSRTIGGGILFTPPQVAASVQNSWLFLGTWVTGGLLAFAGAMAYAGSPRSGRGRWEYVPARGVRAAGGLLTGWTSFVAGFSGATAASAVVLRVYVGRFVSAANDSTALLVIPIPLVPLTVSVRQSSPLPRSASWPGSISVVVGPGRFVMNLLAGLKVSALLIFIALGLTLGAGSPSNLVQGAAPVAAGAAAGADSGDVHLLGMERSRLCGGGDPRADATCPRARAGTLAVVAIYFLLNLLFLYVLPVNELAKVRGSVLDVVADRLLGVRAGDVMGSSRSSALPRASAR